MSANSILSKLLLALQLCLGFWQIGKLTPVGGIIQCGMGWLLQYLHLSQTYYRLKRFRGRVYKEVRCHVTISEDQVKVPRQMGNEISEIESSYLGTDFLLERRESNMLYLNREMSYYITDTIWDTLLDLGDVAPKTVFLEGYKEFWQQVATGGVMSLSKVLDRLILDNHIIKALDNDLLLPVNLCVSEEKLLKFVNLIGLFLQTNQQIYWLIPTIISFTAALMEFATPLRVWLYEKINMVFCFIIHVICDRLPRRVRREVYSLGNWVENLKPSNDIKLKVVRGSSVTGIISGGAKVYKESANLVPWLNQVNENKQTFPCEDLDPCGDIPIFMECDFDPQKGKCHLRARTVALADVDCNRDEFKRMR